MNKTLQKLLVSFFLLGTFHTVFALDTDPPMSEEESRMLESVPEADQSMSIKNAVLPDGSSMVKTMLENDPCFLVKWPTDDKKIDAEAKSRCEKLKAQEKADKAKK